MSSSSGIDVEWEDMHVQTDDVVIGRVLYKAGGTCGPRTQQDYQLVIMHSGHCKLNIDGKTRNLEAGHTYLLLPQHKELFVFSKDQGTGHSWCSVSINAMPQKMVDQLTESPAMGSCSETMERLLSLAFNIDPTSSSHSKDLIESLAITIFHEFLNISAGIVEKPNTDTCIMKAVSYMEQHYPEEDCLINCHGHAAVSRNTLIKKFRTIMNITPNRYLWRLRTENGLAMLLDTGLTVAEIACRCGFKNPFHFSRKVTELKGSSPREIRQKSWDQSTAEKDK